MLAIEPRPRLTLLNAAALSEHCSRSRLQVPDGLEPFIERIWTMHWRLGEDTFVQRALPDPNVMLVVDRRAAQILGPVTGAYSIELTGEEFVFGLKFRPCAFHSFHAKPVIHWTDRKVQLNKIFPDLDSENLSRMVRELDGGGILELLKRYFLGRKPAMSQEQQFTLAITERIAAESSLLKVEPLASDFSLTPRALQRLFRKYVGVSPKWMIRRYRLQEAAARVEAGGVTNWAGLAHELGYFDQSHFINEFSAFTGQSPGAYENSIQV